MKLSTVKLNTNVMKNCLSFNIGKMNIWVSYFQLVLGWVIMSES